jgi:hypothetical protein
VSEKERGGPQSRLSDAAALSLHCRLSLAVATTFGLGFIVVGGNPHR